jgi:hypothetical protein
MSAFAGPQPIPSGLVLGVDSATPKSYSVNIHPTPLDIGAWATGGNAGTYSRDATVTDSPAGGIPLKVVQTGNDPYTGTYNSSAWNLGPALVGQTWTVSVWVKASVATTVEGPVIFGANSAGNYVTAVSAGSINVYTYWTRVSYTTTLTDATTAYIQVRLDGTNTYASTINVWWDGLQVERGSAMTAFTPLTNTNGTTWNDLSSNRNKGTLTNFPTYNSGNNGYLSLDGVNNYISIPNSTSLQVADIFTINVWVYSTSLSNRFGIFSTRTLNATGCWQLEVGTGSGGQGRIAVTGISTWIWESSDNVVATNTWYNICFVKSGNGTQGGSVYLNGTLLTPATTTAYTISNNSDAKVIGQGTNGTQYFPGRISNVTLHNRALYFSEVLQNFNALRSRFGI